MQSLWGTVFISSLTVCEAIQETQEAYYPVLNICVPKGHESGIIHPHYCTQSEGGLKLYHGYSVHKWPHFSLVTDTESVNHNRRITTIHITSGHCTPGSSETHL